MVNKLWEAINFVKTEKPLIHCITNPISINGCANTILAVGAKPIMAEHPKEVREITTSADALMLNLGNITYARTKSIMRSAKIANQKDIPVLLDVVGIACSKFRRKYAECLLHKCTLSVIKGNYSEILALYDKTYFSRGVDAEPLTDTDHVTKAATFLAQKYKTVIVATGKIDIITDGNHIYHIKNGTPALASVTGTGCMLGSLCATFMTATTPTLGSLSACCYFGICGELSEMEKGTGSFMVHLTDKLSTLQKNEIEKHIKMEEI